MNKRGMTLLELLVGLIIGLGVIMLSYAILTGRFGALGVVAEGVTACKHPVTGQAGVCRPPDTPAAGLAPATGSQIAHNGCPDDVPVCYVVEDAAAWYGGHLVVQDGAALIRLPHDDEPDEPKITVKVRKRADVTIYYSPLPDDTTCSLTVGSTTPRTAPDGCTADGGSFPRVPLFEGTGSDLEKAMGNPDAEIKLTVKANDRETTYTGVITV